MLIINIAFSAFLCSIFFFYVIFFTIFHVKIPFFV